MATNTRKSAAPKYNEITSRMWVALRAAYVAVGDPSEPEPTLAGLAKTFGVSPREVEEAAERQGWNLERRANHSRHWRETVAGDAKSEAEFVESWCKSTYAHLVARGPEGERLARAIARDVWTRTSTDIALWEAFAEEREANRVFGEFEARMATRCSQCGGARC